MNKLESKGQKQFWFVLLLSIFPYTKTIAKQLILLADSYSENQLDLTLMDIGEALLKIAIIILLFILMNKGRFWAKHFFAGMLLVLLASYYLIPIAFGNTEYYQDLSIDEWKTRVTNTILYFLLPIALLYFMSPIKAFLRFRANKGEALAEKIEDIGS